MYEFAQIGLFLMLSQAATSDNTFEASSYDAIEGFKQIDFAHVITNNSEMQLNLSSRLCPWLDAGA